MKPEFIDFPLRLVVPKFEADLTNTIMELQYLKRMQLQGSTPPYIFFQLKGIFHFLESLGSARIEGNRTTLDELVETKIEQPIDKAEHILEIENMEKAITFINNNIEVGSGISRALIHQLHKITVQELSKEGDRTPGCFRKGPVKIAKSLHIPPLKVESYMDDFFDFINKEEDPKYDLLKIALAHHRFAWIHPYGNGNGRVVRLLTYAMLLDKGFNVKEGRILNPSAVFCNDRDKYYLKLATADKGDDESLLIWCDYVLKGLLEEMRKIDKLLDYDYLSKTILIPSINFALERQNITKLEARILNIAVSKKIFQSSDLEHVMPGKLPPERSRAIAKLKENKLIMEAPNSTRKYILCFSGNYLLRGIVKAMKDENFIPESLN